MKIVFVLFGLLFAQTSLANVFITEFNNSGQGPRFEVSEFSITTKGAVMRLTLVKKSNQMSVTYELSHENLKYINLSPYELGKLIKENLTSENSDLNLLISDGGKYRGYFLSEVRF